jgi:molybdate transport system substrate-binding protein
MRLPPRGSCGPVAPQTGRRPAIVRPLPCLALAALCLLASGRPGWGHELILSAAISLKEATEELGRQFQVQHPGVILRFNLGSSGSLQKQIEAGAPADLFLSAGQREMDALEREGLLLAGSRRAIATNRLAVIVPADSRLDLREAADLVRPEVRRIALGNPKTVPAGQYAEACLRALGLWGTLGPRLVFGENVRQALEYVSRGEVDAGFVYVTDAASRAGQVRIAFRPPPDSYPPIVYPAAVIAASAHRSQAQAFIDLLLSPQGRSVLARLGFQPAPGAAP